MYIHIDMYMYMWIPEHVYIDVHTHTYIYIYIPAISRAFTSAWADPALLCHPSPTIVPLTTITQPTQGLGLVLPVYKYMLIHEYVYLWSVYVYIWLYIWFYIYEYILTTITQPTQGLGSSYLLLVLPIQ
jgi:hypothetical protein